MITKVANKAEKKMEKVIEATKNEFKKVRTGRARASMLDSLKAEYYGTLTPVNQMANVDAPEARQLVIKPYDASVIDEIEKAILKSDLDLTPNNEGDLIRIHIPQLTEERRKSLAKVVNEKAEDSRVKIRDVRREANDELEDLEKDSEISEDNYHRGLETIQELTDQYIAKIDQILENKIDAIMEV